MSQAVGQQIAFGPFRLERANARLWRGDQAVALTPKALDVLHFLATRPDRLVTKDELLSGVWPDVVVGDASVKVCVREIRKALGDVANVPRCIETVHRRGYRFIGKVDAIAKGSAPPPGVAAPAHPAAVAPVATAQLPPLVGRDVEMSRLCALFERTARGQRQSVFVTGGPGSGKTALVESFVQWAANGSGEAPIVLVGH